jgi:hypothetical protein
VARYSNFLKKYVRGNDVTPVASAAKAVNGNSGWLNAEEFSSLALSLAVSAHAGTAPTLDVIVETASDDQGADSRQVGAFTQKTANVTERKSFAGLDKFYRVAWTVGGTAGPTFTFSVSGQSKG